jgi:transcription elongation GreA/GreB family factor
MNAQLNTLNIEQYCWMTTTGFENLKKQLVDKEQEYAQVREYRQCAFEMSGDGWHDNPEFNRMQQLEANLNHTIKLLTDRISMTRLIDITDASRPLHQVGVGSVVQLGRWADHRTDCITECWEIVGFDETQVGQRQLAYNAPLAAAVFGLHVGDIADDLKIGSTIWDIEILALYPSRFAAGLSAI